ncbi:MAG TPA: cytochrome c [Burkholderiales bacterium]|nr:cytochrome c [Burkholderiales bacterium]
MSFGPSLAALLVGILVSAAAYPADLERGQVLYDNHCRMCHDSIAFKREGKIARNYEEVRAQVIRWQANTSLQWSAEDIENVASYVARTYYKIPCPDC